MCAHLLEKILNGYSIFIPSLCCSALCYLLFKAKKLILIPTSQLTQMDPKFEYNGETLRVIQHLHSEDTELKIKAKTYFQLVQDQITLLINPPSIFQYKNLDYNEYCHRESIISHWMNKDEHAAPITRKELNELEINYIENNDFELHKQSIEFIRLCNNFMNQHTLRGIFVSSIELSLENEKGHFICPLK